MTLVMLTTFAKGIARSRSIPTLFLIPIAKVSEEECGREKKRIEFEYMEWKIREEKK